MVDKIGIPNPMSIGDALTPVHLYMGLNENKAFDVFTDFVTGAENADSWIIHHKHASDDPDESH